MYNLLAVDDEWIIREGLEKTIPWKDWDINLVATVKNSQEAIEILEEQTIQILLTDIKMPGTNGLELINDIKPQFPNMKIIILTGHSEFDYAQRAIKLGADDFLIKPTNFNELENTIRRITNELKNAQMDQNRLAALVIRNVLNHPSEDNFNKLLSFHAYQSNFGIVIVHSTEVPEININNLLLIDSRDHKHTYLFHTIVDEIHWENIIHRIRDHLNHVQVNTNIFVSLLADSLRQLLDIYKQARTAATPFYKGSHLNIYTHHDEKYGLDIEDAILYINNHYNQSINQSELADMFHMSNSYFSRLFKQHTGLNYVNFITTKRLDQAKKLLKSTNLKTYEIAEEVGYPESRYFSQLFKKNVGCTPIEYRNEHKV